MKEKVSIIIPVYNCEKYLKKCVDSILEQTYDNFELLLVNDGSTDNSLEVCKSFKDKRIKVINKKNGGASSARNAGLDKASGDYVMFVDSDDFIHQNTVKELYNNLKKYKAEVSICGCTILRDANVIKKITDEEVIYEYSNIDMCKKMQGLDNDYVGDVVWGKLYKASLFKTLRFVEGMMNEDAVLLHELYYNCKKGVKTSKGLYYYCVFDNNSVSRKKFSYKHLDNLKAYDLRVQFFKDKNEQLYVDALKDYTTNLAFNYYLVKKHLKDKAKLKEMKKTIKNNKNILKKYKISKKQRIKLFFQSHFPLFYGLLLNLNLRRKELIQKHENKR